MALIRCRFPGCWKNYGPNYTEAEYKEDLAELEDLRHTLRVALLQKLIDGIQLRDALEKADRRERSLKGKRWGAGQRFYEMVQHMKAEHKLTGSQVEALLARARD